MKMRVVPTKVHGALDYVSGPALTLAPELFRMKDGKSASLPPRLAGVGATAYSALTDYELGAKRMLPMKTHLALDAASGAALALAPWLGGSARKGARHWLPHALAGATEVALALTTKTKADDKRRFSLPDRGEIPTKAVVAAVVAACGVAAAVLAARRGGGAAPEPTDA